jgi:O-methyltransferase
VSRHVISLLRTLGLTRLARRVERYLPSPIQRWLEAKRVDVRVQSGEIAGLFPEGTLVPVKQLERKYRDALSLLAERRGRESIGDYLEFGVYGGASLGCMYRATHDLGLTQVRLFGFDSFEGLPTDDEEYAETGWQPGQFAYDQEATKQNLTRQGVDWDRVTLVKGWFDETLTAEFLEQQKVDTASVVMIDADLYSSAKTALEFCYPLIRHDAVLFFDDWWPDSLAGKGMGEKRAFAEFLEAHPDVTATELESYYPKAAKVFLVSRKPESP